jgi:phospholipid/cholesterol/gamma-HCH transport system substrate-binding protein
MGSNPAIRVGIIVVLALAAFLAVYLFLTGYNLRSRSYDIHVVFKDAKGITPGSQVDMAGVHVGQVDTVGLNYGNKAVLTLRIGKQFKIPEGSKVQLTQGVLVSQVTVDITPNRSSQTYLKPEAMVQGTNPMQLSDLIPQAQQVLSNLTSATDSIKKLVGSKELQTGINDSLANIDLASKKLAASMSVVQEALTSQKGNLRLIIANVSDASASLKSLTGTLDSYVKKGGVQSNITDTLASAKDAAKHLDHITASLDKVVSDKQFQDDLKQTVHGARTTVEEAQHTLGRIDKTVEGVEGAVKSVGHLNTKIPIRGTSIDSIIRPTDGKFRVTAYTTIPFKHRAFLELGIYDLGGDNNLILQPGSSLSSDTDVRYGIYASKLGIGLDHAFSPRLYGSVNLYNPQSTELDVQAGYDLSDNWGVLLGADHLFQNSEVTAGVRYRP